MEVVSNGMSLDLFFLNLSIGKSLFDLTSDQKFLASSISLFGLSPKYYFSLSILGSCLLKCSSCLKACEAPCLTLEWQFPLP